MTQHHHSDVFWRSSKERLVNIPRTSWGRSEWTSHGRPFDVRSGIPMDVILGHHQDVTTRNPGDGQIESSGYVGGDVLGMSRGSYLLNGNTQTNTVSKSFRFISVCKDTQWANPLQGSPLKNVKLKQCFCRFIFFLWLFGTERKVENFYFYYLRFYSRDVVHVMILQI